MDGPSPALKVPHSEDLVADISGCNNDCSCGSSKDSSSISMPICFLVREQAKSFVAIQDLQNRMSQVENVQVDVIDTLMQFRNFLCESANSVSDQSPSFLNSTKSPNITSTSKLNATTYHSAFEPPRSILKTSCYSPKANENGCSEFAKASSIVTVHDHPQKHFDSAKSKDSALESDKQDSGLDSDCREHNEGHPSVRNAHSWVSPDGSDQLLQLLDEISYRSEFLQKQFAVADDSTALSDMKEVAKPVPETSKALNNSSTSNNSRIEANSSSVLESSDNFSENKNVKLKPQIANDSHEIDAQAVSPSRNKFNNSAYGFIEKKSFCEKNSVGKKIGKTIDSSLVSSILKETNVLELQRQALIYLVDNAVLNTKLREIEHALSCKNVESDKVENSLKEEARLLMMENRELRICLDEQKMETNTLKARVVMLERVLQSITAENQELNWQLGETFNLQHFSKKVPHNLSASFSSGSPSSTRPIRKSSSLPSQSCRNPNIGCGKSRFLSNSNNYLDAMIEEPEDYAAGQPGRTYKFQNGPIQSSTPFQRPKSNTLDLPNAGLPNSFQSLKKCLKSSHSFDSEGASFRSAKSERFNRDNIPETCAKTRPFASNSSHETLNLPMGNVSKFPFNSILEKLKANSEFRLSRSVPTTAKEGEVSDQHVESSSASPPALAPQASPVREPKSSQENNSQIRKSRDIHQRIQNILDRIVAESEEAA